LVVIFLKEDWVPKHITIGFVWSIWNFKANISKNICEICWSNMDEQKIFLFVWRVKGQIWIPWWLL
jgi:hypothetical protein